jgi:hypothetical protein
LGIFLNKSAGKGHWFRRKSRRKSLWRTGSSSRVRRVTGCTSHGHGSSGFLGSRVAGSSSWIPPELLHRQISVPVADHGGSGPHGSWVTGSTGFGFSLSRVISGSRAHRRSRRRHPLVSSAPPIEGSDSISLNSPDLISLSASLSLPLNPLSPTLSHLSHSLYCCLCGSLGRRTKKKKWRSKKKGRRRIEEKRK